MKNIIIILLVVAGVVAVGFAYILFGPETKNGTEITTIEEVEALDATDEVVVENYAGVGSLKELQTLGQSLECKITCTPPAPTAKVEGTYFVANGLIRGDFMLYSKEIGEDIVSSIILDETTMYSWSTIGGKAYGAKIAIAEMAEMEDTNISEPIPSDAAVDYSCITWPEVDNSIFIPPSDVLFTDVVNILKSGMEYGTVYEAGEF